MKIFLLKGRELTALFSAFHVTASRMSVREYVEVVNRKPEPTRLLTVADLAQVSAGDWVLCRLPIGSTPIKVVVMERRKNQMEPPRITIQHEDSGQVVGHLPQGERGTQGIVGRLMSLFNYGRC